MLAVDDAGYRCGATAADCPGHLRWPLSDREPQFAGDDPPGVFGAGDVGPGIEAPGGSGWGRGAGGCDLLMTC